ncbi:MAG: hypothetical protein LBK70_02135 [Clostridiales bacterium]|nr:hypothetical protein [Clostridiales bacterium]
MSCSVVLCILVSMMLITLFWQDDLNAALHLRQYNNVLVDVSSDSKVVVHYVDVGQGDAIIIRMSDGKTVLIDTGPASSAHILIDYIQANLGSKVGFEYFDYIVISTALHNRVGGLPYLARYISSDTTIFRPNVAAINPNDPSYIDPGLWQLETNSFITHSSASYRQALRTMYMSQATIIVNSNTAHFVISNDTNVQTILSIVPFGDRRLLGSDFVTGNSSPIILLEYGVNRWIFSGAANSVVERMFVDVYKPIYGNSIDAKVILLGNNGANSAMSREFLDFLIDPIDASQVVVILSMSVHNSHTHPNRDMLQRVYDSGVLQHNIKSTAFLGHIVVYANAHDNIATVTISHTGYNNSRPYWIWWHEIVLIVTVGTMIAFGVCTLCLIRRVKLLEL